MPSLKPMPVQTITPRVDIQALMVDMANDSQCVAFTIGTKMAIGALLRLAARACEINDPVILKELHTLGLVVED